MHRIARSPTQVDHTPAGLYGRVDLGATDDRTALSPPVCTLNGWRMHYVDEGDPVLLLHGNQTWGFLYRDVMGPLVQSRRRVVMPDMIGFGLSEKPTREWAHTLDGHTANLVSLVRQLGLRRITVV
jgi:haloalkane dehalogenase